jgi:hypothetical protein
MRLVHRQRQTGRPAAAASTACVLGLAAALILALASAGGAVAARTAHTDLCAASKGVAASIVSSTNFSNPMASLSSLKNNYGKLQAAEPSLLAAAAGSPYEADLKAVFPVLNNIISVLKGAHWSMLVLATKAGTLEKDAITVKKPLAALTAYFKHTCKLG